MKVSISRHCHCVARFNFNKDFEFDNENKALEKAQEIVNTLKEESCKTHKFTIRKIRDDIVIESEINFGGLDY